MAGYILVRQRTSPNARAAKATSEIKKESVNGNTEELGLCDAVWQCRMCDRVICEQSTKLFPSFSLSSVYSHLGREKVNKEHVVVLQMTGDCVRVRVLGRVCGTKTTRPACEINPGLKSARAHTNIWIDISFFGPKKGMYRFSQGKRKIEVSGRDARETWLRTRSAYISIEVPSNLLPDVFRAGFAACVWRVPRIKPAKPLN